MVVLKSVGGLPLRLVRRSLGEGGSPTPRGAKGGFTLVEVIFALGILAAVIVVLLERRTVVVRDAARSRDLRTAWFLAAQKLGELELDPDLWVGEGGASNGTFDEVDDMYGEYVWEFEAYREQINTSESWETAPTLREIFRLRVQVNGPGFAEPVVLEKLLPVRKLPGLEGGQVSPNPPQGGGR